jgi:hypothetical protein
MLICLFVLVAVLAVAVGLLASVVWWLARAVADHGEHIEYLKAAQAVTREQERRFTLDFGLDELVEACGGVLADPEERG